jgi:NTP pyrophosphatase (non-canonical NTP hydrolase)
MLEKTRKFFEIAHQDDDKAYLPELYIKLVKEEFGELMEAWEKNDNEKLLDGICDLIFVLSSLGFSKNFDVYGAYNEVCDSNLTKVQDNKILKNEFGKVMKPETYQPPKLKKFLND